MLVVALQTRASAASTYGAWPIYICAVDFDISLPACTTPERTPAIAALLEPIPLLPGQFLSKYIPGLMIPRPAEVHVPVLRGCTEQTA